MVEQMLGFHERVFFNCLNRDGDLNFGSSPKGVGKNRGS
jgi:hypothetical protein